ncbi:MAG: hypothetical protein SLAVMIC_00812 [uncultured marine phage]|uniref:DUF4325 domain-containing protein n=1 Tax=uncultured marine phage TaxID=707152 RepID=A0A8D9CCT7_9VIRU|nr:MAG: hypothetical protein SLAVMIC_00812 [uncultured marine phage]
MRVLKITDYTEFPGPNLIKNGNYSGEYFYNILKPMFEKALKSKEKVLVDLDGTGGFGFGWQRQLFGSLWKDFTKEVVLENLIIKSDEEPYLISETIEEIFIKEMEPYE